MITAQIIQRFQQISGYFNQQQYAKVCSLFEKTWQPRSVPVEIWLMYAIAQRRIGQLALSQQSFRQALAIYPNHSGLHNSYGNLLLEMASPQDALVHFAKVILLDPTNSDGYYNSTRAFLLLGKYDHALESARQARVLQPTDLNIALVYVDALIGMQNWQEADRHYEVLLNQFPNQTKLLNNYGNFKRTQGDIKSAINLLQQAALSDNPLILRNLAACYVLNHEFEAAYACYRRALQLAPDDVQAYQEYLDVLWQQGHPTPFAHIEARLAAAPDHDALKIAYIKILLKVDQAEKAHYFLQSLLQKYANDQLIMVLAVMVFRHLGQFEQAVQLGLKAELMATSDELVPIKSELGYAYLSQLNGAEAKARFQQLCQLQPHHQGWWTIFSTSLRLCQDHSSYHWLCNYELVNISRLISSEQELRLPIDFNNQLLILLSQMHCNVRAPLGLSLQHGSQTFENIFERRDPLLQLLQQAILRQARRFIQSLKPDPTHPFLSRLSTELSFQGSWSVRLRDEGFHKSHFHPMGWLSGVYYVDIPSAVHLDGQGWLMFGQADIPNVPTDYDFAVKPEAGTLVLFPSFMWHGTKPFHASTHRVTIAFDLIPA